MSVLHSCKQQRDPSIISAVWLFLFVSSLAFVASAHGQAPPKEPQQSSVAQQEHEHAVSPTQLQQLLDEAERNNPQIRAAQQSWDAAQQVPTQVSTLPDPQFTLQQVNAGGPRPFAGYTNSDFAYVGLGVSQEIPYPGKLRLRGEMAKRDADAIAQEVQIVRRSVLAGVKSAYFQLAYLSQTFRILESDGQVLEQIEKAADTRYRSGMGNQQEVLQTQVEQTKLLREIAMHHLEVAKAQAAIKQLLGRSQSSPDIETPDLTETTLPYTTDELLAAATAQNPSISSAQQMVEKRKLGVDLAHKDFYPDFNVQYMWQRTDPTQFRAYYMFSVGVKVPIYRSRKQRPELALAEADLSRAQSEAESQAQQVAFEVRTAFDTADKTAELLKIDSEGLLPQARAEFQSGLAAYQNNRQDFQPLLAAFLDVLHLDEEYWHDLADRETALARLEELTGLPLHEQGANQ